MTMFLSLLFACGDKDGQGDVPTVDPCEEAGTGATVRASDGLDEIPVVAVDEGVLVDMDGLTWGFVKFDVTEEGDYLLLAGMEAAVAELSLDGATEELSAPSAYEDCGTEIPEHYDLSLSPGAWKVTVGPMIEAPIWLMLAHAGDHGH